MKPTPVDVSTKGEWGELEERGVLYSLGCWVRTTSEPESGRRLRFHVLCCLLISIGAPQKSLLVASNPKDRKVSPYSFCFIY